MKNLLQISQQVCKIGRGNMQGRRNVSRARGALALKIKTFVSKIENFDIN